MANIDPEQQRELREMMTNTTPAPPLSLVEEALFDTVRRQANEMTGLRQSIKMLQAELNAAHSECDFLKWHNKRLAVRASMP